MHVDEEQLQRLVDGDKAGLVDDSVRDHVAACGVCRARVAESRLEQGEIFALLGSLDHPRPQPGLSGVIARGRTRDSGWMRKAAGIVMAGVLAGAAYAAPGSPLPSVLQRALNAVDSQVAPISPTASAPAMVSGLAVAAGNHMVIVFEARQADGHIRVSLSDDQEIDVRATGTGASFTSGEQLLSVGNANSTADFLIAIPRNAPLVEIRVGESRVFLKDGPGIDTAFPAQGRDAWIIPLSRDR
ncbi:MAG: hypothetical protein ABIR58_04705 [Gemmatimonadaceae bacterium]